MGYTVAKYLRLSLEDSKSDSLSIENQRFLLDSFIEAMDEDDVTVMEFVDNGYSGTNFERPAVQELLELVRTGKIDCIVVKDFSRFGRNMVEAGYFLQMVFPLFHTRFIAVSDAFDSDEHKDDSGGLEVAVKLLLSEQYSRDLSRKIKSARLSRALRGESINKNCAFGFKKAGNRLEVDEPAAKVVRIIFDMKKGGQGYTDIATYLYESKIPTPSEYRRKSDTPSCVWEKSVLLNILNDEQYIGTYVAGKSKKIDVGSKKTVAVDESDWIRIPDHHPAIIDKAVFAAVHEAMKNRSEPQRKRKLGTSERYRGITSPLKGKVYCGCCGHAMRLSSTRNKMFQCHHTYPAPDSPCHRFKTSAAGLSERVFSMIRQKAAANTGKSGNVPVSPQSEIEYEKRIAKAKKDKTLLYEKFVSGEISADEYKTSKAALDIEIDRITQGHSELKKVIAEQQADKKFRELMESAARDKTLTSELVDSLIDRVVVSPDGKTVINWKVSNLKSEILEENENA